MGGEEVQNQTKMILDRLDAVDETLVGIRVDHAALRGLWSESVTDRRAIHARMDAMDAAMEAERTKLIQEAQLYREAMEVRMQAVEARDAITEIRATVGEMRDAIALQLALHRWWGSWRNKVVAFATPILTLAVAPQLGALLRFVSLLLLKWIGLR